VSDLESNRVIGTNQALKSLELYHSDWQFEVDGKIDFVQKYWDITKAVIRRDGLDFQLCEPAMVISSK
jgi:neutral ceramidase